MDMKKFSAPLGILSIFALISALSACSSDDTSPAAPAANDEEAVASSASDEDSDSKDEEPASTDSKDDSSSKDESKNDSSDKPKSSSSKVVVQKVESTSKTEDTYYSNGVFCWTDGCEAKYSSEAQPAPASSASTGTVAAATIDQPSEVEPTIEGNKLIDQRDQQVYNLQTISGKLWMSQNLDHYTANSYCEDLSTAEGACGDKGRFYLYAAAKNACPKGWRLPTAAEVEAANAEVELTWWPIDGRIKMNGTSPDYGLDKEQGLIWIQESDGKNSWRVENYSDKQEAEFQSGSATERAYNVRCVQD